MPQFISCWEEITISLRVGLDFIYEYRFKIYSLSIRISCSSFLLNSYIPTIVARCCLIFRYLSFFFLIIPPAAYTFPSPAMFFLVYVK